MSGTLQCAIFFAAASPVDLDATIILQIVIFFLLLFLLTFLLYRPMLNVLEARVTKTEGRKAQSQKLLEETETLDRQYRSKLQEHRKEAEKFTGEMKQKVRQDENEILEKAKNDSAAMLEEAREQLKKMEGSLRGELEPQVEQMAVSLASKILTGEMKQ
jgi:F-type H+-transporting ATPase subunit b